MATIFTLAKIAASSKRKYSSALKDRVKTLKGLLLKLNNSQYLARGFRFAVGEHGAWIEVQFLDENLMMVPVGVGFGQNKLTPAGLGTPLTQIQGSAYNAF